MATASNDFGPAQVQAYLATLKAAGGENLRSTDLVMKGIEYAQKHAPEGWSGIEKKEAVSQAIVALMKDTPTPLDGQLVSDVIDTVISVVKGRGIDMKVFARNKEGLIRLAKACFTSCRKAAT